MVSWLMWLTFLHAGLLLTAVAIRLLYTKEQVLGAVETMAKVGDDDTHVPKSMVVGSRTLGTICGILISSTGIWVHYMLFDMKLLPVLAIIFLTVSCWRLIIVLRIVPQLIDVKLEEFRKERPKWWTTSNFLLSLTNGLYLLGAGVFLFFTAV